MNIPMYGQLPRLADTEDRHAWELGLGEQGALARITDETRRAAAGLVTEGRSVQLGCSLAHAVSGISPDRSAPRHAVIADAGGNDDRLDAFFPQGSSHWDGLRHVRYAQHGYFGGAQDDALQNGRLGIDRMAPNGIVSRGVLVDVAAWRSAAGRPIDPTARDAVSVDELYDALEAQNVSLRGGDVVVVRTGWLEWFDSLAGHSQDALRGSLVKDGLRTPGLAPSRALAQRLWDDGIAAIAADNPAVEALPILRDEGFLHRRLLALLGVPFGELWSLGELSRTCAELGRYEFMLVSVPSLLPGGSGSPANALALF